MADKKKDIIDRMFALADIDTIIEKPPTLKVASDAMRSVLASIAMLGGCGFVFFGKLDWLYGSVFLKIGIALIGAWAFFYGFLAMFQIWAIMLSGVAHLLLHTMGRERFDKCKAWMPYVILLPTILVWMGLVSIFFISIIQMFASRTG